MKMLKWVIGLVLIWATLSCEQAIVDQPKVQNPFDGWEEQKLELREDSVKLKAATTAEEYGIDNAWQVAGTQMISVGTKTYISIADLTKQYSFTLNLTQGNVKMSIVNEKLAYLKTIKGSLGLKLQLTPDIIENAQGKLFLVIENLSVGAGSSFLAKGTLKTSVNPYFYFWGVPLKVGCKKSSQL